MKICLYLESKDLVAKSGFKTAYLNHKKALKLSGVEVTTDPTDDYEILHLHWFGPRSLYYLKKAKRSGKMVVAHAHSTGKYDLRNSFTLSNIFAPAYERYLDYFFNQADYICTPSRHAKSLLTQRGFRKVFVITNGVDRDEFSFTKESRAHYREKLKLNEFTCISAGNVIPRKGIIDFIKVAQKLPQLDFVWYGHRWNKFLAFHPTMHRWIENRPSNVKMPGFFEDAVGAYSAGDVFFFPSYGENQPLVLLETASLGIPPVVRDLPEYGGWLKDGVNCLKGETIKDFTEILEKLSDDRALWDELSKGQKELAEKNRLENVGKELKKFYSSLLN